MGDYQLRYACLYWTIRLPLKGFQWNLIFEHFSKIYRDNSSFIQIGQELTSTSHVNQCTFFIISRSFLLRMRNVSDRICTENQSTHFVFSNFFFRKLCRLWDNVEKYCRAGQATDECTRCSKATNTHSQYVRLIAIPLQVATRTRRNFTLYEHCMSFPF